MGLDQYAYVKTPESGDGSESPKFIWHKHFKLQTFMVTLYTEWTGLTASDLNCGELELETTDIETLEQVVKGSALPPLLVVELKQTVLIIGWISVPIFSQHL